MPWFLRLRSVAFALLSLAVLLSITPARAQTVTTAPSFAAPRTMVDAGNGPLEFKMLTGSMAIFTSNSSGVGQTALGASSTGVILTAVPSTPPCVGCVISGTGITAGTTVAAYSVTSITLSAAMAVATSTTLSWGASCPAAPPTAPVALVQAGVGGDFPFYTYARICAYGGTGPGGQYLTFPIGAH